MITQSDYASLLRSKGKHLGEVRKNRSDDIMNATFTGDIGFRRVYILDPKRGWHYEDAKFARHSAPTIIKDQVDSYLQFRPKIHYPVGTYVFIPDDTSYKLKIDFEHPFNGDVSNLWLIVGKSDSKQFVRYLVLRINWNLKWVVGYGDKKQIYSCWSVARSANSYTSGVWNDFYTTGLDNLTGLWLPNTYYVYGDKLEEYELFDSRTIAIQTRTMITVNDINPNCYVVTKNGDMHPKGLFKLSLKADDFNPKRDNVALRVCDYYHDTGDIAVIDPPQDPDPYTTSVIHYMVVDADNELTVDDSFPILEIGNMYYYEAEFSDEGVTAQWRIELIDDDGKYTEKERYALERLMVIRDISSTVISIKPGKSNKLKGLRFKLSVTDVNGNYESSINLEVAE